MLAYATYAERPYRSARMDLVDVDPDSPCHLLSLPGTAWQLLMHHLISRGSRGLRELMTACKATRHMVLLHACKIRYTARDAPGQHHQDLRTAAARSSCDLELSINMQGLGATLAAAMLWPPPDAQQLVSPARNTRWTAVRQLQLQVRAHDAVAGRLIYAPYPQVLCPMASVMGRCLHAPQRQLVP
jgi:hypothetical protein